MSDGPLDGLKILVPTRRRDERGQFDEGYHRDAWARLGLHETFVQDNFSESGRGVLRGLHWQNEPFGQGKLVRVLRGRVFDVAVDLRPRSPTYRRWYAATLEAGPGTTLWLPAGLAHGFLALEDETLVWYKVTRPYHAAAEEGLRWDDPSLGLPWPDPGCPLVVSVKDASWPLLDDNGPPFQAAR